MTARLLDGGRELWLDGAPYVTVLDALHARAPSLHYFEIGVLEGETLRLARGPAVGVDPVVRVPADVAGRPGVKVFEQTSDAFFAAHDLALELGGKVQLAFLDGLHRFEVVLRDMINTERAADPDALILLHDGLPRTVEMTGEPDVVRAGPYRGLWTGDVWKMVPVLRRLRPDLEVRCLDAAPTGLIAIRRLNPCDRTLADAYDRVVSEWASISLRDYGLARLVQVADIESAAAWLREGGRFHDPRPAWKTTLKRWLRRP